MSNKQAVVDHIVHMNDMVLIEYGIEAVVHKISWT